jgi:hypothetical protein
MALEEWRFHSTLFGGRRFAGFPIMLFLLTVVAVVALANLGVEPVPLAVGVVVLAGILGLQTGAVGFESSEAIRNLLGEVTLLLYSPRTLPVSGRTVFLAFLAKDLGYYGVIALLPITAGLVAGLVLESIVSGVPPISLRTAALGSVIVLASSLVVFIGGVLIALLFSGIPLAVRAITAARRDEQTRTNLYQSLNVGGVKTTRIALAGKSLLDVHRSSGGLWKLVMSSGMLVGSAYVVVELVARYTVIAPSYTLLFSTLLSATVFTTYTWLTRIDDPADYRFFPVSRAQLLDGKALAFIGLQTVVLCFVVAGVTLSGGTGLEVLVASVLFSGLSVYLFGLLVRLVGFSPSEALFDGVAFSLFAVFGGGVLVIPIGIGLFAVLLPVSTMNLGLAVIGYGTVTGVIGYGLYLSARSNTSKYD